jgi:putative ABC transport system ATP-binding protein
VFQSFNLFPHMSVVQNVTLAPRKVLGLSKQDAIERAHALLNRIGLWEKRDDYPDRLSGGQQQRVAIARAIVNTPQVILADEPTGNLDSRTSVEVIALFQELWTTGLTVLIVTHEPDIAEFASRVILVKDGKIQSDERRTPRMAKDELAMESSP